MIKFFRKIRQNLLSENKFSKYLIYAIGEIILVVIGILIALSINNWNEGRKLKAEERELLTNLKQSFTIKLNELERKNNGRTEHLKNIGQLMEHIKHPDKTISEEDMFESLQYLNIWYTVNEEFNVINMLFSSGKINIIANDSLKANLITWPDNMEEMLEEQRALQDLVTNRLNPIISTYISSANLASSFRSNSSKDGNLSRSPYPNDFKGLLTDRKFESLVAQKALYLYTNIADTKVLISEAQTILRLIDEQLKNE